MTPKRRSYKPSTVQKVETIAKRLLKKPLQKTIEVSRTNFLSVNTSFSNPKSLVTKDFKERATPTFNNGASFANSHETGKQVSEGVRDTVDQSGLLEQINMYNMK